jgi:hypothetical protein
MGEDLNKANDICSPEEAFLILVGVENNCTWADFIEFWGGVGRRGIWDDLLASLGSVGGALLDSVTPHIQDLQDQLTNHALNAAQSLLGTLSGISGTLQGRQLADAFGALLDEALGHLTSIATSLLNVGLASVLGALGSGKRDIWGDILGVVTDVGTVLAQQLLVTALGSLLGKRGIWDDLMASLSGVVSSVSGTVGTVVDSLTSVSGVLLDSVTPHIQDLQDQLTNHALNAAQSLLGTLLGISGTLQG